MAFPKKSHYVEELGNVIIEVSNKNHLSSKRTETQINNVLRLDIALSFQSLKRLSLSRKKNCKLHDAQVIFSNPLYSNKHLIEYGTMDFGMLCAVLA